MGVRDSRSSRLEEFWSHWRRIEPRERPCPVCGSPDATSWARETSLAPGPIVECVRCSTVFISPLEYDGLDLSDEQRATAEEIRHSDDLADLERSWEVEHLHLRLDERDALRRTYGALLRRLEDRVPGKGRLLDFGSGWGFFLEEARSAGWETQGVEVLPGPALYARAKLGLDVWPDVMTEETFPEASFDAVTSLQVFEHLENPGEELDKIHRVLKPGGLLCIEVPNIDAPLVKAMRGRHRHFVPDHLNYFSPQTLRELLIRHGFEPVEVYYPERYTSLKGLTQKIVARYVPQRVTDVMLRGLSVTRADRVELPLTFREVVTVIAVRP